MSELGIRQPCDDCPLIATGEEPRHIWESRLILVDPEKLEGCRHPWRVAKLALGDNPNTPQRQIMAQLVEMRGKQPTEYGLPPVEQSVNSEREQFVSEEQKAEAVRIMTEMLIELLLQDLPVEDVISGIEELMTEFCSRPDFNPAWAAEALLEAQGYITSCIDTN